MAIPRSALGFASTLLLSLCSVTASAYTVTINNQCPYDIHTFGSLNGFTPDANTPYQKVTAGTSASYTLTAPWSGGRIYGCWNDIGAQQTSADVPIRNCGWVELTLTDATAGNVSSNISYVDFISIPMQIQALSGGQCGQGVSQVSTSFSESAVQLGCPTAMGTPITGGVQKACMSATKLCDPNNGIDGNTSSTICTALDSSITSCTTDSASYPGCSTGAGASTFSVFGCETGSYWSTSAGEPYCMALNRGVLTGYKDQSNPAKLYPGYPTPGSYNIYAGFIHNLAGAGPVFALPYDDYPSTLNEGGYVNCPTSTGYAITFCNPPQPAPGVALSGASMNPPQWKRDRVEFSGTFESPKPLNLASEKILIKSMMLQDASPKMELASGVGNFQNAFPVPLFSRGQPKSREVTYATRDGTSPKMVMKIKPLRDGRYRYELVARNLALTPATECQATGSARLTTAFSLDKSGLLVSNTESWRCQDSRLRAD